jgi:ABC-type protease/lipase transport system fused ATPase/permease subunit
MARLDKVAVLKDGSLHDFGPAAAVLARVHESPPRAASAPVLTIAGGARR